MKTYLIALILLCSSPIWVHADSDSRKDSFDVIKYVLKLNVSDLKSKQLFASADILFTAKINQLQQIRLDLFGLTIDSILIANKQTTYTYNDSLIHIDLLKPMHVNDSAHLQIYYHGKPKVDKSGFGGMVFSDVDSGYVYVLGVAFNYLPHTFGRSWFPCVDNFTDKALFEYYVTTKSSHKAFCNGLLLDSAINTDGTMLWHWKMNQPIVPYLAAIASAQYTTVERIYTGLQHSFKLICAVPSYDTMAFRKSFANFQKVMAGFEKNYGLYRFDRAGYFGIPFTGGAMESASNIGLPNIIFSADYGPYNRTWAHELSHHWWGDLMTCASAEDMWLNEGWACFSESMYEEIVNGKQAYIAESKSNHFGVLMNSISLDHGARAISPMPQLYTYGNTIYKKGADAAHTLRSILGDSLFFIAAKNFLDSFAFKSASSDDFRKSLIASTGLDSVINNFFAHWIYSPGLSHFYLDSLIVNSNNDGTYHIQGLINQNLWHATGTTRFIPLQVSVIDSNLQRMDYTFQVNGHTTNFDIPNFKSKPALICLNLDNQIEDATTKKFETIKVKTDAGQDFSEELISNLSFSSSDSSAGIFIEHHWVAPSRGNLPSSAVLAQRYWTVDGIWKNDFNGSMVVSYDGGGAILNGIDSVLLKNIPEDSIRLLYRYNSREEWKEYYNYKKNIGNKYDHAGTISISGLKKGEYTFSASYVPKMGINEKKANNGIGLLVYPNPAKDYFICQINENLKFSKISLLNMKGIEVFSTNNGLGNMARINTSHLASGSYILYLSVGKELIERKIMIK